MRFRYQFRLLDVSFCCPVCFWSLILHTDTFYTLLEECDETVLNQNCVVKSVPTYFDVPLSGTGLVGLSMESFREKERVSGWSLCEARIHNSQFKVAVKRFTATLSSNYGNHNESLRSELNCGNLPTFLMEPFSSERSRESRSQI